MDILEPIKAMKVEKKKEMVIANGNRNNTNMFNVNNGNSNNKNVNNGNSNNKNVNNGNRNNNNLFNVNNGNSNNKNVNNGNRNNTNLFNMNNGNRNNKNIPGRPIVKIPSARINANNNGNINNLRNFVKTPKMSGPSSGLPGNKKVNTTNLVKTIEGIKNELGAPTRQVMSTAVPSFMSTRSPFTPSVVPSAITSVISTVSSGQYTKNNLNRRTVEQLRKIGTREFSLSQTMVRKPGYGKNQLVRNILNRQLNKLGSVRE
jgi:hypothetical protein